MTGRRPADTTFPAGEPQPEQASAGTSGGNSTRHLQVATSGLLISAIVLTIFRLHAFDLPLEADECNYAYIGARLLEGRDLYVDVWDHQPYGVFAMFAAVIAILGDEPIVFRLLTLGFSLVSLVLVFGIGRRLASLGGGLTAAMLFALASSDPGTGGEGANREIYMNTLILAGWWLLLRPRRACKYTVAAGICLGLASTFKTIVAVHWLFLAAWLLAEPLLGRRPHESMDAPRAGSSWPSSALAVALFGTGPAIIWLLSFAYFAASGRLNEFVDAVFLFNLSYSGQGTGLLEKFALFFDPPRHPFMFESAWPLWLALVAGLTWLIYAGIRRRSLVALSAPIVAAASFVAISLPGKYWPHYYYLMIPPAAVVGGALTEALVRGSQRAIAWVTPAWSRTAWAVYLALPAALATSEYLHYLNQPLYDVTFKRYNSRDFWARAQAENVRRVTEPGDEVFVYSNDACIYYYSDRRSASRYTMMTGLDQDHAGAEQRREVLLREIEQDPPRLIMVLFDHEDFDAWKEFLLRHYTEPVGWDFGDCTREPIMFVVARKDRPIESIDWDWDRREVGGWCPPMRPGTRGLTPQPRNR